MTKTYTLEEWHEDIGPVLWWTNPVSEPPYVGSPLDAGWPGYHTHWTEFECPTFDTPPCVKVTVTFAGGHRRTFYTPKTNPNVSFDIGQMLTLLKCEELAFETSEGNIVGLPVNNVLCIDIENNPD